MPRGLNRIEIIGRLGRDPEMRYTQDGKAVVNFSVATGGKWTDRGGVERDDTEWFRVEMWDRLAETANQYLTKGAQVFVEGRLKTRKYNDKDGIERTSVDVVASNMVLLGSRNEAGGTSQSYGGDEDYEPAAPASRPVTRPAETRAPAAAPARPAATPARPAPTNGNAGRAPARNVPQPMEDEEDLPF